jgi:hypothetical protein
MHVILCSSPANAHRALCWAIVLCQLSAMRLAAGEAVDSLVEDAVEALDCYQNTIVERPRDDLMFGAPWTAR